MCIANTLHQKLNDKLSANDPIMKALGYEGLADPIGDFKHRLSGTQSELTKKVNRNQAIRTQSAIDAQTSPQGGHVKSIAAMKLKKGL